MSILVQRKFHVAPKDRAEFERQSREGLWPAFLEFGAQMVAYGRWEFAEPNDGVVTHTVYEDFEHWNATRKEWLGQPGAFYRDEFVAPLVAPYLPIYDHRNAMIAHSQARLIDVNAEVSAPSVHYRRPGTEPAPAPSTFGRGSVVSERTYSLEPGAEPEFLRLSRELIWPWLESVGARMVVYGQDPLDPPDEVVTLFAFRSLEDWHRLSRPGPELEPSAEVVRAWGQRAALVRSHRGRLLTVLTDFGAQA
ncbi:MAG: hypothetical protein R3C39_05575 [Dehalococcoidia bacterium]